MKALQVLKVLKGLVGLGSSGSGAATNGAPRSWHAETTRELNRASSATPEYVERSKADEDIARERRRGQERLEAHERAARQQQARLEARANGLEVRARASHWRLECTFLRTRCHR